MIVVTPDGNDSHSGTQAHPFRTLGRALEKARAASLHGKRKTTTIQLGPGIHVLTSPVVIGPDLTGPGKRLLIRGSTDAETTINGTLTLTGARPVARPGNLPVSAEAKGHLWEIPIPATVDPRQFQINGVPQSLAVWPKGDDWESWPTCEPGTGERRLRIPREARKQHANPADVRVNVLSTPYTHWINYIGTVTAEEDDEIELSVPLTPNRYLQPAPTIPFRFENALEALTAPGEWCVDTAARRLYFWPPAGINPAEATFTVPRLACLLRVEGSEDNPVCGVRLQGLHFSGTAAPKGKYQAAVELHNAVACEIRGCTFQGLGGTAIRGTGIMRRNRIAGCQISNCDASGIVIHGPDPTRERQSLNNLIEKNQISECGRVQWSARGISLGGSSHNRILRNTIEEMPYTAISISGARFIFTLTETERTHSAAHITLADLPPEERTIAAFKRYVAGGNIIEMNTIRNVMMRLDDGAAIYCHASHHNIVRRNHVSRAARNRSHGLYFDDDETDSLMEENTVIDCPAETGPGGSAIHVHDNANNTVRRNQVIGTNCAFTFPSAYGGHNCVGNVFILRPEDARNPVPPKRNAGRYQEIHWDAGGNLVNDNIYWSPDDGVTAQSILKDLQAKGFDLHSRVENPA